MAEGREWEKDRSPREIIYRNGCFCEDSTPSFEDMPEISFKLTTGDYEDGFPKQIRLEFGIKEKFNPLDAIEVYIDGRKVYVTNTVHCSEACKKDVRRALRVLPVLEDSLTREFPETEEIVDKIGSGLEWKIRPRRKIKHCSAQ